MKWHLFLPQSKFILQLMTVLRERQSWVKVKRPSDFEPLDRLTSEQERHVRAAMAVLRIRFGSFAKVAKAMKVQRKTVERHASGRGRPTPGMAIRVASLVGVTVDEVLTGKFPLEGSCPYCGRIG